MSVALAGAGCAATASGGAAGFVTAALPRVGEGAPVDLSARRGAVLVIEVGASWAEGSPHATRALAAIAPRLTGKGVEFYGILVDADLRFAERHVRQHQPPYPVLADLGARESERTLGLRVVPTVLVVDKEGRVRARLEGYSKDLGERVAAEVTRALGDR